MFSRSAFDPVPMILRGCFYCGVRLKGGIADDNSVRIDSLADMFCQIRQENSIARLAPSPQK